MAAETFFVSTQLKEALGLTNVIHDRHEIVSALINYVKENDLIDEKNKMVYRTDATLEALMNGKNVTSAFSAIRDLGEHVEQVDDDDDTSQGEGQLEAQQQLETDEEEEEEGEEEEEEEQWHRELTVQNDQGKCLTLTCIRRNGESVLSINGVELYESEFEDYYARVVGNKPSGLTQGMDMCLGLIVVFTGLTVVSLWLSLLNQGLMRC